MKLVLASSLLGVLSVGAFQVALPSRVVVSTSRSPFMVSQLSETGLEAGLDATPAEGALAEMTNEVDAPRSETPKKVERERHTIFIGNLNFGT
jgi:hypothetical protein